MIIYKWNMGDGTILYGENISYTYHLSGNYIVTLSIIEDGDIKSKSTMLIAVLSSNDDLYDLATYKWDMGDGNILFGSNVSHTYNLSGQYIIKLITIDRNGVETDISSTSITILNSPLRQVWSFGDGTYGVGEEVEHTYHDEGVYNVTLFVGPENDTKTISVGSIPNTIDIDKSYILGACFYNDDIIYISSFNEKTDNNFYSNRKVTINSVKNGELIKLPYNIKSFDFNIYEPGVKYFKDIKIVNDKIYILFYNNNPIVLTDHNMNFKTIDNKNGVITSLDYANDKYIAGISKMSNSDTSIFSGTHILTGESLKNLKLFSSKRVQDICYDKFRDRLYILNKYNFEIYDKNLKLLKSFSINPVEDKNVNIRDNFLSDCDFEDVRKIDIENDISINDSIDIGNLKLISTSNILNGLSSNFSKGYMIDKNSDIVKNSNKDYLPLFNGGNRDPGSFSLYSRDNSTGTLVELNNNKLIISFYNQNSITYKSITLSQIPISDIINYNDLTIKIVKDIIIIRYDNNFFIFKIDYNTGEIINEYTFHYSNINKVDTIDFTIYDGKIIIPTGTNSIIELDYNLIGNGHTIKNTNLDSSYKIYGFNYFEDMILVSYSKTDIFIPVINGNQFGYISVGLLNYDGVDYSIIELEDHKKSINFKFNENKYPIIKVNGSDIVISYNIHLSLKYDKFTLFGSNIDDVEFIKTGKLSISADNMSIKQSVNRNFVESEEDFDSYDMLIFEKEGIIRDFNSDIIYNIVSDNGGFITISDTYTDRKRIDISVEMDSANPVKRLKTDNYDINVDETLYPKISKYIKSITESDLDKLCTLILSK